MFILSINMWFQDLMRTFFFNIDKIVFNFISTVYDLLITIARTSILSQADILDMADRIYKLLAVFMVFKVTFSLIMYVVNPDDFSDKSKGVSKLGMNIVFSLAMLILTPYIFNYAYQFQTIILEDNSLGTLIFGEDAQNAAESPFNTAGDTMAFITLTPFFTPNLSLDGLEACSTLTVEGEDANGNKIFNEGCKNALGEEGYLDDGTRLGNYVAGVEHSNLGLMFRLNLAVATDENENNFIMEYRYIFSTVVGVVVVLLLITFCMDIAVRSIKLAFLQLIAPIPILSYVDPKSGKDGMFKKWYQMCFKTYLSLFIRLLALYFAVYIISRIDKMVDIVDGSYVTNSFIKIFIIIGALMFAKQLPKMLEGLGIKLDGDGKFTLNPIKKFQDQALGAKVVAGGAAALGAAGLSGATNFVHRGINTAQRVRNASGVFGKGKAAVGGVLTTAASTIAGATRGGTNAFGRAIKDGKFIKGAWGGYQTSMYSKLLREDNLRKAGLENAKIHEKIGFGLGSVAADLHRYTGTLNAGQHEILDAAKQETEISNLKTALRQRKTNLTKLKEQHFEPYETAQKQQKMIDDLLEGSTAVKTAKGNWQNAISRGESDERIEELRQIYKYTKGKVLDEQYHTAGSAISIAVNRHNEIVKGMDAEHKDHYKEIDTKIKYTQDKSGTLVKHGNEYYEIKHGQENGYDVEYIVVNGEKIYNFDSEDKYKATTGVNVMGDNDDSVADQKTVFESSEAYVGESKEIQKAEREIEALESELAASEIKNPNSIAKIQNDSRLNRDEQKPGFKPSANQSSQAKITDNSMYSDLGSGGHGDHGHHSHHGGHGGPGGH